MPSRDTAIISSLLDGSIRDLDITPEQFFLAQSRYMDLAEWLVEHGIGSPDVYPQGSFRLGTVLRPGFKLGFDIDLVFLRFLKKTSVTQQELRDQADGLLRAYVEQRGHLMGNPKLDEKGRCFTLTYESDGFHMDVLPVIPNEDGLEDAILLSDRDLRDWLPSNPIGYANWFWSTMGDGVEVKRSALAEQLERDIEDVPRWLVRTTLQRVVQLLKLHRNVFFTYDPDLAPPSILITTLAGQAYGGDEDIYTAFQKVAATMSQHIELRDEQLWVQNPADENENFADKWNTNPERKEAFFRWEKAVQEQAEGWGAAEGIDRATAALGASFGTSAAERGATRVGKAFESASATGALSATSTGAITVKATGTRVPKHEFHGE